MPRPPVPNIDPFDLDPVTEANGVSSIEDLNSLSIEEYTSNVTVPETTVPLGVVDLQPSNEFQADAAFLQSAAFEPEAMTIPSADLPPPLPETTACCDWYLPPPELGTSLLAEYLTDFNTAFPLYQPHVIAEHLRICYAGESDGTSVAWTSAYVVFGLAHS
jgi:hypothetical protein